MKLQVNRTKNVDSDRRGNVRGVTYTLAFQLLLSNEEQSTIHNCGLEHELIFQSQAKIVSAYQLIGSEVTWTRLELPLALSIQQSMVENCQSFAALVRTATTFEGRTSVELGAV